MVLPPSDGEGQHAAQARAFAATSSTRDVALEVARPRRTELPHTRERSRNGHAAR